MIYSKNRAILATMLVAGLLLTSSVFAQAGEDSTSQKIVWITGPATGDLAEWASLKIPEGYSFAGKEWAGKIMEMTGNLATGTEVGVLVPDSSSWFLLFMFDDCGYVADDEKSDLDADAILKTLKDNCLESNKERVKRSMDELFILDWKIPPQYEPQTHNLQWAYTLKDTSNLVSVNLNTRLLGRDGVMEVLLAANPDSLEAIRPTMASILTGFSFKAGRTYSEYRDGDKLAEYGLTALVVGGGAALAAKTGMFKYIWKLLVVAVAGGAAFIKKIFAGRRDETKMPPELDQRKDNSG